MGGVPRQELDTPLHICHARGDALSTRFVAEATAEIPCVGFRRVYGYLWGGSTERDRAVVAMHGIGVRVP